MKVFRVSFPIFCWDLYINSKLTLESDVELINQLNYYGRSPIISSFCYLEYVSNVMFLILDI